MVFSWSFSKVAVLIKKEQPLGTLKCLVPKRENLFQLINKVGKLVVLMLLGVLQINRESMLTKLILKTFVLIT